MVFLDQIAADYSTAIRRAISWRLHDAGQGQEPEQIVDVRRFVGADAAGYTAD